MSARPSWSVMLFAVLSFTSCRRGMVDQQHLKPLAEDNFFEDSAGSRVPPAHTVARGQLRDDEQFFTGKIGNELAATMPKKIDREMLERGRERFGEWDIAVAFRTDDCCIGHDLLDG